MPEASEGMTGRSGAHDRHYEGERLVFLAEASRLLASSLDYETTLQQVASLMVPHLADWCAVELVDEDGAHHHQVAVAHTDPAKVRWAHELRLRYPPDPNAPHGVPEVIRSGRPEFYPTIPDEMLARGAVDEEHLRIIRQIGFSSAIVVPLQARGEILGALTLVWSDSQNHYTEEDLRFAEELGNRSGMAIDNARLYRQREEAEQRLRALNESLETLVAERTQALERANRELRDFAHVASHDLQEPLRKIRSFSMLLKDEYAERLDEGRDYLDRIDAAAARMQQLITDLLAFSRVARTEAVIERIDLRELVEGVLSDLEIRIEETQGRVEVGEVGFVEGDPLQIRQLLQNLIGNALKFHRPGVPPVVHVRSGLDTDAQSGEPVYRLEVEDNGIGFEEKFQDRIFTPFQRLHNRSLYAGTGMGLAICRRIVERHGGTILARSTLGEGSTFSVLLPVHRVSEAASQA